MIVTKENQKLYPSTWGYNAARIMTALAAIIKNNNGRVKYGNAAIIENRSIIQAIRDHEMHIEKLKTIETENETKKEKINAFIKKLENEIKELKQIDNTPRRVTHTSYISFVLDNNYYYFQIDDNPFFEFYYTKTPIKNGRRSLDACSNEDKKEWLKDCYFSWKCSDDEIKAAAEMIFNMLYNAPYSIIRRDGRRQRVKNTYNNGYHYEIVYAPERIANIDF